MKKTGLAIIISGTLVLAAVLAACAPPIPHAVEARMECTSCHGSDGVKPYPSWHAKRGYKSDDCASCHDAKVSNHNVAGAAAK
jgi:hypothetical protein